MGDVDCCKNELVLQMKSVKELVGGGEEWKIEWTNNKQKSSKGNRKKIENVEKFFNHCFHSVGGEARFLWWDWLVCNPYQAFSFFFVLKSLPCFFTDFIFSFQGVREVFTGARKIFFATVFQVLILKISLSYLKFHQQLNLSHPEESEHRDRMILLLEHWHWALFKLPVEWRVNPRLPNLRHALCHTFFT